MRIKEKGRFVGYAHIPWLGYILIAGAILITAVLLYVALVNMVNCTTLRAGHERLWVRHGAQFASSSRVV